MNSFSSSAGFFGRTDGCFVQSTPALTGESLSEPLPPPRPAGGWAVCGGCAAGGWGAGVWAMSDSPVVVTTNASHGMSLVIFFMFALAGMEEADVPYYMR